MARKNINELLKQYKEEQLKGKVITPGMLQMYTESAQRGTVENLSDEETSNVNLARGTAQQLDLNFLDSQEKEAQKLQQQQIEEEAARREKLNPKPDSIMGKVKEQSESDEQFEDILKNEDRFKELKQKTFLERLHSSWSKATMANPMLMSVAEYLPGVSVESLTNHNTLLSPGMIDTEKKEYDNTIQKRAPVTIGGEEIL